MSSTNGGSASNSGATSTSGPAKNRPGSDAGGKREGSHEEGGGGGGVQGSQPTRLEKKAEHVGVSESAFLAKEAADARKAISNTVAKLKGDLTSAADLGPIVGGYPWLSLGAAAVAGFVGGTMVVKSKHERAIDRLAALEKAMALAAGDRSTVREAAVGSGGGRSRKGGGGKGMVAKLFDELVKPALMSAVTAGVTAKKTADSTTGQAQQAGGAGAGGAGGDPGQYS